MVRGELLRRLECGELDALLTPVYGRDTRGAAMRLRELILECADTFPIGDTTDILLFSTPGRTEICGNHTDHQHGHGLAASVDLDTIACVIPNDSRKIRIKSRHHRLVEVDLNDLSIHPEEADRSVALVRGIASRFTQLGYTVGGFDAYTTTRVLRGSGLSSSAAFEVLTATIIDHLFCKDALDPVALAKVGQYAENVYFKKPCGLMDQLACSIGGILDIDFRDPDDPEIRRLDVDLASYGHALCIVDTRASHSDLTADFAAIPQEMRAVADCFGRETLVDVDYDRFIHDLAQVRSVCGDRAALRAYHFFHDDQRAVQAREALENGDFVQFLHLVNASGRSSLMYLQNVSTYRESRSQPVLLMLALAEELLDGRGASRVHGGGFAGTIQAFVPLDMLDRFVQGMEAVAGKGACHILSFRSCGTTLLVP